MTIYFMKPTDDELVSRWMQSQKLTAFGLGDFLRYKQGVWNIVPQPQVEKEIMDILITAKVEGIKPTNALVTSVREICRIMVTVENSRWDSNPDILVCQNGTLDIPSRKLRDHSPDDYATQAVPYAYLETAKAPAWQKLLSILPANVVPFLQEFAGYCLTTDTSLETAVWLYGLPGSGKSSFIMGIMTMTGPKCCQIGLKEIERSRFALTNLPGRTVAVSTEQPTGNITSSDLLNKIISGEPIIVDRKFKDPVEIYPRAKVIWGMNELPRIPSGKNGLFRRVKLLECPVIPMENQDPQVKEQIKIEGAGILNWALDGLDRLRNRGCFEIPESVKRAINDFKTSNDVSLQFIADECILDGSFSVQAMDLYRRYRIWCENNGHRPFSSTRMAGIWIDRGLERYEKNGCRFYRGIGLKDTFSR
jgi:putative DNA primase/helicase